LLAKLNSSLCEQKGRDVMAKGKGKKATENINERNEATNEETSRKKGTFPEIHDFDKKLFLKRGVEKDVNGISFEAGILLDLSRVPIEEVFRAAAEHYHIRLVRKQVINVTDKDTLLKMKDSIDVEALRSASRKQGQRDPVKALKTQVAKLRAKGLTKDQILELLSE
jgi:hypothetical protein